MIRSASPAYRPVSIPRRPVTDGEAVQAASTPTQSVVVSTKSDVSSKSVFSSIWESVSGFFSSMFSSIMSTIKGLFGQ
ncbi:MAG: hypothetical protein ACM3YO_02940 [Bacteroidota bacterium]